MRERNMPSRVQVLTEYTMRGIDAEFWRQVRSQAALEGLTVRAFILKELAAALPLETIKDNIPLA
jgi:hypothetical protein